MVNKRREVDDHVVWFVDVVKERTDLFAHTRRRAARGANGAVTSENAPNLGSRWCPKKPVAPVTKARMSGLAGGSVLSDFGVQDGRFGRHRRGAVGDVHVIERRAFERFRAPKRCFGSSASRASTRRSIAVFDITRGRKSVRNLPTP